MTPVSELTFSSLQANARPAPLPLAEAIELENRATLLSHRTDALALLERRRVEAEARKVEEEATTAEAAATVMTVVLTENSVCLRLLMLVAPDG
jgi:hypothetical protein